MLDFSPEKMMMIFFIAMLVLGPEKLPEMARKMGKIAAEVRKLTGGFQNEIRQAVNEATTETSSPDGGTTTTTTTSDTTATVVQAGDATASTGSPTETPAAGSSGAED